MRKIMKTVSKEALTHSTAQLILIICSQTTCIQSPLFWVVISLCKHCFIFTVTSDTPTITALLSSHQTPPFVLGTQVHYFKVHLPTTTTTTPPPPPSCLLLPLNSFCFAVISGLFNRKTFSLLSDMLKMLTPIQCSLMQLAASFFKLQMKNISFKNINCNFYNTLEHLQMISCVPTAASMETN